MCRESSAVLSLTKYTIDILCIEKIRFTYKIYQQKVSIEFLEKQFLISDSS